MNGAPFFVADGPALPPWHAPHDVSMLIGAPGLVWQIVHVAGVPVDTGWFIIAIFFLWHITQEEFVVAGRGVNGSPVWHIVQFLVEPMVIGRINSCKRPP